MSDFGLKALVLDWGGVLTPPLDEAMARWAQTDAVRFEHFRDVMRTWVGVPPDADDGRTGDDDAAGDDDVRGPVVGGYDPDVAPVAAAEQADVPAPGNPVHRLERGELPVAEFEALLADELGRRGSPVSADGLVDRVIGGLADLSDTMVGLVRRARAAGLRTALLSNSWGEHYPDELFAELFDVVVVSGRVGMRKPEARIYRHVADLLGLEPSECVLVDDLPHNIHGAAAVGMVGVLHTDYASTLAELEILFDRPLG